MNKRLQVAKRKSPGKEKDGFIVLTVSNGNPALTVNDGTNVKLPSIQAPWYPIFRAKKYDPL